MLGRMDEVAAAGAGLIVFPEAYVPGYPTWVWRLKPGADMALADGGAVIVRPSGKVAAGPLMREKGVLYGEIDPDAARRSRRSLDVTGHYARPDVFELRVDRSARPAVAFRDT